MNAPAKFFFAVIVYTLLAACNVSALEATTEEKNIRFETLWRNNYGGYAEGGNLVIKSAVDWKDTWDAMPDDINFAEQMFIAVLMGQRNTGGYAVEIVTIVEKPAHWEVGVKYTTPEKGALVTQALTQPHHIIKLKKTNKEIIFINHTDSE